MEKIIASQDGDKECGAIVWWTLKGRTSHEKLTAALVAEQSTAIPPEPPSAMAALAFACGEVARVNGLESRNLARGEWALVRNPEVDGSTLSYDLVATAKAMGNGAVIENAPQHLADAIQDVFQAARQDIPQNALSAWLCAKLEGLGAVGLRDRGGVYFVPGDVTRKWWKLTRALKTCGQDGLHYVPAMKSADAIDAILSALTTECEDAVNTLMAELSDGDLGARALETRKARTEAIMAKLERYEGLLGKKLPEITARVAEARIAVVTAHTVAEQAAADTSESVAAE